MLPSKIDQMKASHETGSEANFGFGYALMPSKRQHFSVFGCSQCLVLSMFPCQFLDIFLVSLHLFLAC